MNHRQRDRKFAKHGAEFGASNSEEYERLADEFLGGIVPDGIHEHTRPAGDRLRYDPQSEAFGVLDASGIIRTFFRPVPCSSIADPRARALAVASGLCHGHSNNLLYFQSECGRIYGS